jgi:hypothetical protein
MIDVKKTDGQADCGEHEFNSIQLANLSCVSETDVYLRCVLLTTEVASV